MEQLKQLIAAAIFLTLSLAQEETSAFLKFSLHMIYLLQVYFYHRSYTQRAGVSERLEW